MYGCGVQQPSWYWYLAFWWQYKASKDDIHFIFSPLMYFTSSACELKKIHCLEFCGILLNSLGSWSNTVKWLSFPRTLFLGMESSIFLIKESWQGDFSQWSPGLAQNLRRQRCKHLIFRSLLGKDTRGHTSLARLSNLQHHSGSQVFGLTLDEMVEIQSKAMWAGKHWLLEQSVWFPPFLWRSSFGWMSTPETKCFQIFGRNRNALFSTF